ncbi:ubiquitin-conjugating enzyme E2 T [Salpingoeca rosetta]|uniref:E2 ubiquitin-conjugating enzyme n=1 Tax=Salpingoeca rosetta (strain ATCC 50818 / BSB-021) TaxID=946362 RepID=F2U9D2_SALR5|nr:ubiquitin-conjugating enzyme E2 T [Salpingoeca rosetta]EGD73335.1 ubiquitin-conjugating enzyme E2 T [Salpingoeca rosetta]|eukprot:XP_004994365.1 ubiquitin-conjugating enzyme E2 T [Salpingoeca rosetta]
MAAQRARLMREIQLLKKSPPPGVQCWVHDDSNVTVLHADVAGPPDSPYEKGVFRVELDCSGRYPFEPPKARFITPIYHPNIDTAGRICLDLLKMPPKGSWKPSINISTLLTSLQLLMGEPNPEDGLLPDVSSEFKYRRGEFLRKARAFTQKHAVGSSSSSSATATASADATGKVPESVVGEEDQTRRVLEEKESGGGVDKERAADQGMHAAKDEDDDNSENVPVRVVRTSKRRVVDPVPAHHDSTGAPPSKVPST